MGPQGRRVGRLAAHHDMEAPCKPPRQSFSCRAPPTRQPSAAHHQQPDAERQRCAKLLRSACAALRRPGTREPRFACGSAWARGEPAASRPPTPNALAPWRPRPESYSREGEVQTALPQGGQGKRTARRKGGSPLAHRTARALASPAAPDKQGQAVRKGQSGR
eukprot:scaffold36143_cov31-Tisochrysis_lutea.AAC.5